MNKLSNETLPENAPASARGHSLPRILRGLGAITLLASVSIYLYQGLGQGSDISRFVLLFMHTVGLAGIGLACSRWLKEQKGARLLLMLTLVFSAANFAIIGAFIYSITGASVPELHGAVTWVVQGSGKTLAMLLASFLVLVPLIFFGFKVIARRSAMRLSAIFALANTLLLLPTRDEVFIGVLALASFIFLLFHVVKARANDVTLRTKEGLVAQAIVFVPLVIMLGRNMMHSVGDVIPLIMSVTLLVAARQSAINLRANSAVRTLLEVTSIVPIFGIALCLVSLVDSTWSASWATMLFIFASVSSALLLELSVRSSSGQNLYGFLGVLVASILLMANILMSPSLLAELYAMAGGAALIVFAFFFQRRYALLSGSLLLVVSIGSGLITAFESIDLVNWFVVAGLGVGAIVLGSLVEKYGEQLKSTVFHWRQQLHSWDC
ncbi:MAG TPA: hypothetical protein VIC26_12205 [Marinagarivorans sp.]